MSDTNTKPQYVGGMWKRTMSDGSEYLSFTIEEGGKKVAYVAFGNSYKTADNQPDFKIQRSKSQPGDLPRSKVPATHVAVKTNTKPAKAAAPVADEDVPVSDLI